MSLFTRSARRLLPFALFALGASAGTARAESPAQVAATVQQFHDALKRGDKPAALSFLTEDALIYESGSAESRSDYAAHHLAADIEFAAATTRKLTRSSVRCGADTCLVLQESSTEGNFKGKPVHVLGVETTVLLRQGEGWKIRHVHWSSRQPPR